MRYNSAKFHVSSFLKPFMCCFTIFSCMEKEKKYGVKKYYENPATFFTPLPVSFFFPPTNTPANLSVVIGLSRENKNKI